MSTLTEAIDRELLNAQPTTALARNNTSGAQTNALLQLAQKFPDIDWRRNELTTAQSAYCANAKQQHPELEPLFSAFKRSMQENGAAIVSLGTAIKDEETARRVTAITMHQACNPFGAYKTKGFFHTLVVNPNKPALRADSVGIIPFHFDLDQAVRPPEFVGLFCVRPDPNGGGANQLVNYNKLFAGLTPETTRALQDVHFSYETLYNTHNLGEVFNPHPVLQRNFRGHSDSLCRYNGKARPQFLASSPEAELFDCLEKIFERVSTEVALHAGDFLLFDQRQILHARRELAPRRPGISIPPGQDRLLLQLYGNPH